MWGDTQAPPLSAPPLSRALRPPCLCLASAEPAVPGMVSQVWEGKPAAGLAVLRLLSGPPGVAHEGHTGVLVIMALPGMQWEVPLGRRPFSFLSFSIENKNRNTHHLQALALT